MTNQTNEALVYIEREYEDVKWRVELQRHVIAQLHMWLGDKLDVAPVKEVAP